MSAGNSLPIMEDKPTEAPATISYPLDDTRHVATPSSRFRRQLLKGAAGTIVGAAVVYFGWTRYLFAPMPSATSASGSPGVSLGAVSDFAAGAPPKLVSAALPGSSRTAPYLVENNGGTFRVLSAVCTHLGCTVAWSPPDSQFICPCHGARYDITGKNVAPPAPRPLPVVPCHVQNGTLYVQV